MKKSLILISALALAACQTYHTSKTGLQIDNSVKNNLTSSIHVGPKVSGTTSCNEFLFFLKSSPDKQAYIPSMMSRAGNQAYDDCTAGAVYDAISKNNADMLIEPQYTTVKKGFLCTPIGCLFGNTKVIVTGYSATISSIK